MATPWVAEFEVNEALATALLREQFNELNADHVSLLGTGWDNTAFLVGEETVFRFPRRQIAASLMETECHVLPRLANRLPAATPVPIYLGRASKGFPWPFAGYQMLPGTTACRAKLTEAERHDLADQLGLFASALHKILASEAVRIGAGPDPIQRLNFEQRAPRAKQMLWKLDKWLPYPPALLETVLFEPDVFRFRPSTFCLVHGDLYSRHILIDSNRRLMGVIDWGDVHLGDPAADLMVAYSMFSGNARTRFFEAYGPVTEPTKQAARCRALHHTLHVLAYALDIGDPDLKTEAVSSISRILSLP